MLLRLKSLIHICDLVYVYVKHRNFQIPVTITEKEFMIFIDKVYRQYTPDKEYNSPIKVSSKTLNPIDNFMWYNINFKRYEGENPLFEEYTISFTLRISQIITIDRLKLELESKLLENC